MLNGYVYGFVVWLIWDWIFHEGGFQMIRHHVVPLTQMCIWTPQNETMPLLTQARGREEQWGFDFLVQHVNMPKYTPET